MGVLDDIWESDKDAYVPDVFRDEKAPSAARIKELNKEADAAAEKLAEPQKKITDALKQKSNAAHGRLSTLEKEWGTLKTSPGDGHRAPPEQWYKDAEELQRVDDDLKNAERQYDDGVDYFKKSLAYSHAARRRVGDLVGSANKQTEKVYMRTNLELTLATAVFTLINLRLKGGPAIVVGIAEDKIKDAIKAQEHGEKEKDDKLKKGLDYAAKAGDWAQSASESEALKEAGGSGIVGKLLGSAGVGTETGGYGKALQGADFAKDATELKGEFDKAVPQLSIAKEGEEGLDEIGKDLDNFPDSVDKLDLKNAIADAKNGLADVEKSKEYLLEAAEAYAKALEAAEKLKVTWSKPKG